MRLDPAETKEFYSAWLPLLAWTNQQKRIATSLLRGPEQRMDPQAAVQVRDALFVDDALLGQFVAENPAKLPESVLSVVASWRYRRPGNYMVWKHYRTHSLFLDDESREGFAVLGLQSAIEEVLPMPPPVMVKAVLLPFRARIITDGLIVSCPVHLGSGIRARLKQLYQDATERGAIRTTLLPTDAGQSADKAREQTNLSVLKAFHKHLLKQGLSPKIADCDEQTIAALAQTLPDCSLREWQSAEIRRALQAAAALPDGRGEALTGLTRYFKFLADTARMDGYEATQTLKLIQALK